MVFGIKGENRRLLSLVTAVGFGIAVLGQTCSGEVEMSTRRGKNSVLPVITVVSDFGEKAATDFAVLPGQTEISAGWSRKFPMEIGPAVLSKQEDTWTPVKRRRKKGGNNPRDQNQNFKRELKTGRYYNSRDAPMGRV